MNPTLYVNSAGQADTVVGNVNNQFVNDAIEKLRTRARGASSAYAGTKRPAAPGSPVVNDTTRPGGIMNRIMGRAPLNPINDARAAALAPQPAAAPAAPATPPPAAPPAAGAPPAGAPPAAATTPPAAAKPAGIVGRSRGALSRAGGAVAKVAAPLAVGAAIAESAEQDSTARYAERFNVSEPTGDGSMGDMLKFAALRAGGFASDLGNTLTGGLAGKLYRDKPGEEPAPTAPGTTAVTSAPAAPGAGGTTGPTQTDLSKVIDDPGYIPEAGTGMFRNERTGRVQEVGGDVSPEQMPAPAPSDGQAKVTMPDASLLLNSGTVGNYLTGATAAANATIGNAEEGKGIVRRKARAEAGKAESEESGAARLDKVMAELESLNDSNDPGGTRRLQLRDLALTLGGNAQANTTDTGRDRYLRSLTKSALTNAVTPEDRAAAQQYIDEQMRAYDAGGQPSAAAGQQFEEGKVYIDGQGNRAKYEGGKWVAA